MKSTFFLLINISLLFGAKDYFQQDVAYTIEVTLDDSAHTLHANEKIIYTNNSPDTLQFIWFHLWPNAYKNTETAFAKQGERFLSTRFLQIAHKLNPLLDSPCITNAFICENMQ